MIRLLSLGAAMACAACVSMPAEAPRSFVVIEENATISYSERITTFERVSDSAYLLRIDPNRWYKAELKENCARGATDELTIRIDSGPDPAARIDTFSYLVLDDLRRCRIQRLDRIQPPRDAASA
ncbi:MAG TPA: DUF6491 family protein [Hyphomonadaceae bacterium]|nr:DUF6491 family protein [Hyphomonadaceae bacterium]